MRKAKSDISSLALRARQIKVALEKVKPLYQELDEITEHLARVKANVSRYGIALQDNFETKNTAWKSTAIRRYEIVLIPKRFQLGVSDE